MSTIVSKLYTRNLVYIPVEYLIDSGIMDSRYLTIEYNSDSKIFTLASISKENASKLLELENERESLLHNIVKK